MSQAYIIHQYPYRDDAVILKLLSVETGFMTAMAKGIKKSRWQGLLRAFTGLHIEYAAQGEMPRIKLLEAEGISFHFTGAKLYAALYLNELLMRFFATAESHPEIFIYYQEALAQLEAGEVEPALRHFELNLLAALGYAPPLVYDETHHPLEDEWLYQLLPGALPKKTTTTGVSVYKGVELKKIAAQEWSDPKTRLAAKRLMRAWIAHYTHGKPFRTRQLYV